MKTHSTCVREMLYPADTVKIESGTLLAPWQGLVSILPEEDRTVDRLLVELTVQIADLIVDPLNTRNAILAPSDAAVDLIAKFLTVSGGKVECDCFIYFFSEQVFKSGLDASIRGRLLRSRLVTPKNLFLSNASLNVSCFYLFFRRKLSHEPVHLIDKAHTGRFSARENTPFSLPPSGRREHG